jgi:hypothetical protein
MIKKCRFTTAFAAVVYIGRYALLIHGKKKIPLFAVKKIKIEKDAHLEAYPGFSALRPVHGEIIREGIHGFQDVKFFIHLIGR